MRPAHTASSRHRTWAQRAVLALGCAVTLVCLGGAAAVGYLYEQFNDITRYDVELAKAAKGAARNYLIVGSDSREGIDPDDPDAGGFLGSGAGGGRRSDTIMVLRVDPRNTAASLLSLPRDLYVPIAGTTSSSRINSAYGRGPQVLIDTIRAFLGIDIHHYVEVDFAGFKGLVEAIDGVRLWFDTPVRDTETGLLVERTGCVQLGSQMALNFARSRKLEYRTESGWYRDPTADLGRITRQQIFIKRAIKKAVSKGLGDFGTLNDLVGVAVDNVGLDPGLNVRDILALARRFSSFDAESLKTYALPVESFRGPGGASVVRMREREAEPVLNVFRGLAPGTATPRAVLLTVLNGSGAYNQATDVANAMRTIGFTVVDVGDADGRAAATTIRYAPADVKLATLVARYLSSGASLVADPSLARGEVVLVTGPDFTTVHDQPAPTPRVSTTTSPPTTAPPATSSTSTSTTVVGRAVGAPPEGESC